MGVWSYDPANKRFISPTGRPLSQQATVQLRNRFAAARGEVAKGLAEQYTSGAITKAEFTAQFQAFVEETNAAAFLAGRGGANVISDDDVQAISKLITDQLGFADAFADEVAGLSADEIAQRASLYADASVKAFELGKTASHGLDLPFYPGDWETECKAGCRCYWEIEEDDTEWRATWVTASDGAVCADCQARGDQYGPDSPFTQSKSEA